MKETAKNSAIDVAIDMLEREFQIDADTAERIARRVMSVILPPLEKEVELADNKRQSALLATSRQYDAHRQLLDRLAQTIESILNYARSIGHRHGHYVDVPIDDRTAFELESLLRDWERNGGSRYRSEPRGQGIDFGFDPARGRSDQYFRDEVRFVPPKFEPTLGQIEDIARRLDLGVKADTLKALAEERIRRGEQQPPGGTSRPPETPGR